MFFLAEPRPCRLCSYSWVVTMDVIVELRAGRMRLADGKLCADPRKGLIQVCQARKRPQADPPSLTAAAAGALVQRAASAARPTAGPCRFPPAAG